MRVEWLMGIPNWVMIMSKSNNYNNFNKVGVNAINDIEDPILEYYSTLFKTKTDFEESVLRMMYIYRKDKFIRAMLALLEGVTWVMANADRNNILLKYLLTIDPPAYTCHRYWDWIEPHIKDHIQTCSDNVGSGEELETCMRIYSNIEHIKHEFGALLNTDNELLLV